MQFDAPTEPSDFDEAAAWFLDRTPMTREAWDELSARAQRRAFMVSGVAQADVLADVFKAIDRSISTGDTLGDFRKAVQRKLEDAWQGTVANPAWRTEVIFRNAVQGAYSAGRIKQMRDPDVADIRPYWMFDAILDARTSEICEPLAGTVLPMDHPWWKTHTPPCHHACRSGIRSLRESQAERRGITQNPSQEKAAKGFGLDPTANEWQPDLNRYPNELRQYVAKRLSDIKESKPKPPPKKAKIKRASSK
jgi:SPP1 gp7 family putative phage head morphogenesis protein